MADKNGVIGLQAARYKVGDSISGRRTNMDTNAEISRTVSRITKIEGDLVEINEGDSVLTLDGGLMRLRDGSTFDPPRKDTPSDGFFVGKKWTGRNIYTRPNGNKTWAEDKVQIEALEEITVPAGTFKAFRLKMNTMRGDGIRITLTYWVLPDWPFPIRSIFERRFSSEPAHRELFEAQSITRGAG